MAYAEYLGSEAHEVKKNGNFCTINIIISETS